MDIFSSNRFFIKCPRGCVPYLRGEIEALGYKAACEHDTGIEVDAPYSEAGRFNLYLRTASRVEYFVKKFPCPTPQQLYSYVLDTPWEDAIAKEEYLSVSSVVMTDAANNTMFVNQKVKDAICDRLTRKIGARPDSGPDNNNVVVNIYWKGLDCYVYLDTSGNKLSDRGYRRFPHSAPMQEVLAAGLLLAAGYDGTMPLVNPMCGSGTMAIEAALIALGVAPGFMRSNFGFMHLKNYDAASWELLRASALKGRKTQSPAKIIATDIDPVAIEAAKKNAQIAGVADIMEFRTCDFNDTPMPQGGGIVMLNPEYGVRLGDEKLLGTVYKGIGDFFKQKCAGYRGYIFTGNANLAKQVGLRTKRKLIFFNAQIECRLLEYELYSGSKRGDT